MTTLAEAAASYAARGWHVFPCRSRGKAPLTADGFKAATADADQVAAWWDETPDANIGMVPARAGLLVLDLDGPEGEASARNLKILSEPTLEVVTGRGRHRYYRHPGGTIGNEKPAPGIDVRADAGYVLLPPSVHETGARYTWRGKLTEIIPLPPHVVELLGNGTRPAPATPVGDTIPEGSRNATLASLAGTMRRRGLSPDAIAAALLTENATRCRPPLDDDEVRRIAESVGRYPPATASPPTTGEGDAERVGDTLTDSGNAARLIALHGDRLRFVSVWGRWLVWDDAAGRWLHDHRDVAVRELAKDVGLALKHEAAEEANPDRAKALFRFALRSLDTQGVTGLINLARGIPGVPLDHEALDADGWLLGVENGVVDLRTGTLRPAVPADLITKQAPVRFDPDATAPRWARALAEWFPDPGVRGYVQRVAGAALVGVQRDHVLIVHFGSGGNGKGTFTRALQRVLGPYTIEIHLSLLVDTKYKEHDTVKADLFRGRLAVAVETERRVRLAEASVKNLTGGDRIRARRMREDPWAFDPSHSLWLQTNHLPEITGRDAGIWRRLRVVEWVTRFEGKQAERDLDDQLAAEAPGILAWLVRGCLDWQRQGLDEPEAVVRATLAYREREDVFRRFATDTGLVFKPDRETPAQELQRLLNEWAEGEGVRPPAHDFADWLREKGGRKTYRRVVEDGKKRRRNYWIGVGIGAGEGGGHPGHPSDTIAPYARAGENNTAVGSPGSPPQESPEKPSPDYEAEERAGMQEPGA